MQTARLFEYLKDNDTLPDILIVADDKEAATALEVASFLGHKALTLPDFRASFLDDLRSFKQELNELFIALYRYYHAPGKPLLIAPLKTLLHRFPKKSLLATQSLHFGDTINDKNFKDKMHTWGYTFVDIVQMEGEISFRGDIIDIFSISHEQPLRISLFDDEIESIRYFDLDTQKSVKEELESVEIFPAFLAFSQEEYALVASRVDAYEGELFAKDMLSLGFWFLEDLAHPFVKQHHAVVSFAPQSMLDEVYSMDAPVIERGFFDALEVIHEPSVYKTLHALNPNDLLALHKEKHITLVARNELALKQEGIVLDASIRFVQAPYAFSVISAYEMVLSINHTVKKSKKRKASIVLDELKPGDYVVHETYGLALFEKITQATIMGGTKDFVSLLYQGEDRVLVPVDALEVVDRYVADSGTTPTLDRLGKGSFAKLKEAVKSRLFVIAGEIINLAASRALLKAPHIQVDASLMRAFAQKAGFDYTPDQVRSIEEILEELQSGRVMDRLLSGDVGFGKTEVAMNAIYAVVQSGFQVAFVVPTTLLSNQHYHSLVERFKPLGLRIAKLDRFATTKEKQLTLVGLQEGTVDVVVGTHALFGVKTAKLGLVIIDEEHKFGVQQKEKLKELYENVHLLSMSATPIPRSLNMALSSIKTMSELTTPPLERKGVRTFVKAYDAKLVKEAVHRELRRGGQVFYIFNNIAHMEGKKRTLLEIMPELKIVSLHSKISAVTTEKELLAFGAGKYEMMLATSIIESGIHMPNVNTIIIDGADRFGIADLHQLRGRVGRGHTEGYCYFFVENKETLTPESTKRLIALESNSYLGSGQALAYQDLEIRGGGNLIGEAQSGHIKQIGYALYLRMLEDALSSLSNTKPQVHRHVDLKLTISAFISERVVSEDRLRLELYRRLSHAQDPKEVYEIQEEVQDRFGVLDTPTVQFFELMVIKLLALEKEIKLISNYNENLLVEFENATKKQLKAKSKDDDDIIATLLQFLRTKS